MSFDIGCPSRLFFSGAACEAFFGSGRFGKHFFCLFVGDGLGVCILRDLGVLFAICDVGAVAAVEDLNAITKVGDVFLCFGFELGVVEFERLFVGDVMRVNRLDTDE